MLHHHNAVCHTKAFNLSCGGLASLEFSTETARDSCTRETRDRRLIAAAALLKSCFITTLFSVISLLSQGLSDLTIFSIAAQIYRHCWLCSRPSERIFRKTDYLTVTVESKQDVVHYAAQPHPRTNNCIEIILIVSDK